ncbi:MAG TPA: hypothetical protein PKG71_02390 [Candidatus Woesebacteria bacterium]|nr:hypothetical protein [Candidatus Woesebacteria bacterium]HNS94794.1 hypothetical protein [Candidatus Woesebacteria bacterium]
MISVIEFFLTVPFINILLKLFIVSLSVFYVFYSILMLGQIGSLRKIIITDQGDLIQFVSTVQLVVALAVFVISLIY